MIGEDGSTKRDHLKRVADMTNKSPKELQDLPELPESAAHVWGWFLELNGTRQAAMNGALPISYLEMLSWQALTLEKLARWEVIAIKALDRAFMNRKEK